MNAALGELESRLVQAPLMRRAGRVMQVVGTVIEAELSNAPVGALARVGGTLAEVIGFKENRVLLMPLGSLSGVSQGDPVQLLSQGVRLRVGKGLIGRILDPLGNPLDDKPLTDCPYLRSLDNPAPSPLKRHRIERPLATGVRAIDGLMTLGLGQRVAIMAGSGVGKSTLLGMIARYSQADVTVAVMVGERGREVREFIERDLGDGLQRAVLVVATSDLSPVLQVKAVQAGISIAEHFRDQGRNVMFMCDSLTRLAMAQRQIGLAAGEPPTTRGYTPSVFALLPRLLERCGPGAPRGSITAVTTVLVEGDDMNDPVADTVRGILDGHIVLSRRLASHGHFPAIDVLESLSRTMPMTTSPVQVQAAARIRDLLATYRENEELIRLAAYKKGSDPAVDVAIDFQKPIETILRQDVNEHTPMKQTVQAVHDVARRSLKRK